MRRALMLTVAAALLAACSPAIPGTATPTPTPAPTGITLPPRPRELPLDTVDPCALLTPAQRATLGLDGLFGPDVSTAPLFAGRKCSFRGYEPRAIAVALGLATGNGIEVLLGPGAVTDELTPITVAGFPAVLARPENPDFCAVDVDVARGQFLDVQFADGGRLPPIPQDQLCRDVVEAAEQAVRTLSG